MREPTEYERRQIIAYYKYKKNNLVSFENNFHIIDGFGLNPKQVYCETDDMLITTGEFIADDNSIRGRFIVDREKDIYKAYGTIEDRLKHSNDVLNKLWIYIANDSKPIRLFLLVFDSLDKAPIIFETFHLSFNELRR